MSYTSRIKSELVCGLCPHTCRIPEDGSGVCRVRANEKGTLSLPYFGKLSAIALDPIEKKPLYHFYPGSSIFSVGFYGCSFRCPFCQNYRISQDVDSSTSTVSPEECVKMALKHNSFGIAYTYSEPLVHFEYVLETSRIAREKGLKNILVTNGYINPKPAKELLDTTDAANVDLKSFSEDFYRDEIGGSLKPVLRFIKQASESIHLEITTLVIPGKNDSEKEISEIARFIASVDRSIPLHLSAYYPTYKYVIAATSADTIRRLTDLASMHLDFVYPGNIGGPSRTVCPSCGSTLIERRGYYTQVFGIKDGSCSHCGHRIYGVFNLV